MRRQRARLRRADGQPLPPIVRNRDRTPSGEIGLTIRPPLPLFLDLGQVHDASPSDIGTWAQTIAGDLSQTQSNVTFRVKQPVNFGLVGVRYAFPVSTGRPEPYVIGGAVSDACNEM